MSHIQVMFDPKTIALIGATEKEGAVGRTILENLLRSKERRIFPVNPHTSKVLGVESYPAIAGVPEHVDLAPQRFPQYTEVPPHIEGQQIVSLFSMLFSYSSNPSLLKDDSNLLAFPGSWLATCKCDLHAPVLIRMKVLSEKRLELSQTIVSLIGSLRRERVPTLRLVSEYGERK